MGDYVDGMKRHLSLASASQIPLRHVHAISRYSTCISPKSVQNASRAVITRAVTSHPAFHTSLWHPLGFITQWKVIVVSIHHGSKAACIIFCHPAAGSASRAGPAVELCVVAPCAEGVIRTIAAAGTAVARNAHCRMQAEPQAR